MSIKENFSGDKQISNFRYSDNQEMLGVVGAEPNVRVYDVSKESLKWNFN